MAVSRVPRLVRVDAQGLLGADRVAHGRDHGVVVARASDLEVDHLVVRETARAGGERGRVVALREAEEVELVLDGAAEEGVGGAAERPSQGIPARRLDARDHKLRELRCRLPAAARPDLVEDRLDLVHAAADDLARDRLSELRSRERHLADRLAPPDHAVLGVDGEEDEVGAHLRAALPVELLHERERDGDGLHARDPHAAGVRVCPSASDGSSLAMRSTAHSSDSRITSCAARGSPVLHAS